MYTNIKIKNRKELQLQVLVDLECMYTGIDKQLVKIRTEPINKSFKVFNADRTRNKEVTRFVLLEVEINRYKKQINTAVMDLNSTDIFLGYNWLVKHNPEVGQNIGTIQFTKCLKICQTKHQDIIFISRSRIL